jgi:hypothetical protein
MPEKTRQHFDRLHGAWRTAAWKAGRSWCGLMHDSPMWPIHGQYECGDCGRRYSVPWAGDGFPPAPANPADIEPARILQARVPSYVARSGVKNPRGLRTAAQSFRSALLPRVILAALLASGLARSATTRSTEATHAQAAEPLIVDSTTQAAMAFARYTAGLEQASPWSLETVEIEAALPKLEKQAHLHAIRRLLPLGKPEYQVLEIAGDQTVTRQVIARYLTAEVRAAALPAASVAVTSANYKFRYKCALNSGERVIYAFLIAPRKKREGLIKGELWIDGETGAVVRQSGYLVERPSIFVKSVNVIQQTALRNGSAEERVTHLSVDTRLVGRAELIIHERPYTDPVRPCAAGIEER